MSKFNPGDKVRLLNGADAVSFKGAWSRGMAELVGSTATLESYDAKGFWRLKDITWVWDDRYLVAADGQAGGLKFDQGKDEWHLLLSGKGMIRALRGVVGILMFGAKKYAAHSWREVEDNERRYLDGLFRHYSAIMEEGLTAVDEESGKLHIDHLNCNGLFLGELARCKASGKV